VCVCQFADAIFVVMGLLLYNLPQLLLF